MNDCRGNSYCISERGEEYKTVLVEHWVVDEHLPKVIACRSLCYIECTYACSVCQCARVCVCVCMYMYVCACVHVCARVGV